MCVCEVCLFEWYIFFPLIWVFRPFQEYFTYRADRSSKVGENRRTRGKTTWPSVSRTWLSHMWPERGPNHSGEKPNGLRVNYPITKTCRYNIDPLKPHFYIVKLGFTGVYIIFLIFAQNLECGYSLEPPRRGGSNEYQQSMFWAKVWKISEYFYLKFINFWRWNFLYIWIGVFS